MTLEEFGLNAPVLIAGFAGGVCYLTAPGEPPKVGTIVCGLLTSTLTANYVVLVASKYLGAPELFSAWVVGLTATWICKRIVKKARSWDPTSAGSSER